MLSHLKLGNIVGIMVPGQHGQKAILYLKNNAK
jgi:hypothetical protein